MNIKSKIAIFLFAIFISLFLFNAIASSCCCGSVDILKIGKRAGYEIIANVLAEEKALMVASFNMAPNWLRKKLLLAVYLDNLLLRI